MALSWSTVGTFIRSAEYPPWPEYLQIITLPLGASWVTLLIPFLMPDDESHCSLGSTDSISPVAGLSLFNASDQRHSREKWLEVPSSVGSPDFFVYLAWAVILNSKCITEQTKQWIRKQLAATTTEPMVYSTLRHLKQNHQLQQRAKTSQRLLFLFAN